MAPLGHILDANTIALWRMDETDRATPPVDATGNSSMQTNAGETSQYITAGQIDRARFFVPSSYCYGISTSAQNTALLGELTVEAWACPSNLDVTGTILCHGPSSASESEPNNHLLLFRIT